MHNTLFACIILGCLTITIGPLGTKTLLFVYKVVIPADIFDEGE